MTRAAAYRNIHHRNGNVHPEMAAYQENFGNQIEVLSGLSADERYIASAEGKLFNGAG
jgi:hypothetical protein